MSKTIKAGVLGYLVLAGIYMCGILVAWIIIGEPPFDAASGDLAGPWVTALLVDTVIAAAVAGWVCRSVGGDQKAVALFMLILVTLALGVILVDALIGPTESAGDFFGEALWLRG